MSQENADVIVVGCGLAGLVAAGELADAGRRVILVDQEPEQSIGGQAFWSFGGVFLVDTPEQRRMGIRDSRELALSDWLGTAAFDRAEDDLPRQWAESFVDFAAGEARSWLRARGIRFFPVVGWAERGGCNATGRGNSVPRFHITWGTGPGLLDPFIERVKDAERRGRIVLKFRHRVTSLIRTNGVVCGVRGDVLEPSAVPRGARSSRAVAGEFELSAGAVIVTSGGIGGNPDLVRQNWPARMGEPPARMLSGVPHHVDGLMLAVAEAAGASVVNRDRMWHYVDGVANWDPIWPDHGIRILPGPSSLWLDAHGRRLPPPFYPGFDTSGTLAYLRTTGFDHSWFILTSRIVRKEFALSGSEQNPDLTSKRWFQVLRRATAAIPEPVRAFLEKGTDFITESRLDRLVGRMNALTGNQPQLDADTIAHEISARDAQLDNPFGKDAQIAAIRAARAYRGDHWIRTVSPHRLLDPSAGPLIAVRLSVLTRKTLGGLRTDLSCRVLASDGQPIPGLFAAGEVAGFGGGGMHGNAALEGTFLGGCLLSGREAGRAIASEVA
ncbi:MAG: KsdD-like steroid dehydrogenase [Gemmatimonadaceae bacterium]|nr:KsdD-like steroid dehydrogenase [Gemmatimonadaceae bacterium]